jgi:hypothetical protein
MRLHQEILFGLDGNDAPHLGGGWAEPEPGRRWTSGDACDIRMIHPGGADLLLEIDAFPLIVTPAVALQRIEVVANGAAAGTLALPNHRRRALHIPAGVVPPGEMLVLRLVFPDAARPAEYGSSGDSRMLAVCFSRLRLFTLPATEPVRRDGAGGLLLEDFAARTDLAPAQALARFEGLGETDGFARAQDLAGVTMPGLLAGAAIGLPHLLHGIEAGFEGLGEPGSFDVVISGQDSEYAVLDRTYAAIFRSHRHADEIRLSDVIEQQGARLRDLRHALARRLLEPGTIFVLSGEATSEQEVLPLLIALNRHAPARLLWVTDADAGHSPGTVQQTTPHLLRGWIGRADAASAEATLGGWLELCANVLAIVPGAGAQRDQDLPARETDRTCFKGQIGDRAADASFAFGADAAMTSPERPASRLGKVQPMDGEYSKLQDLVFGEGGNEEAVLGFGWAGPEPGYRWTDGTACELWLDHPGERNVVVSIEAWPLVHLPAVPRQVAELSAHDTPLGALTFREPARQAAYIPAGSLRRGRILRLRCGLPHATRPMDVGAGGDDRQLGLGFIRVGVYSVSGIITERRDGVGGIDAAEVEGRAGLLPEDLLMQFEPLGETRALTSVQAAFGAASQGLLRSAGLRLVDLVRALDTRFAGLGDPARLRHRPFGEDTGVFEITDAQTNLSFLADRTLGDATLDLLVARQARRLKFLRDQLLYDVSMGEKIFVYHRASREEGLSEALMLPLLIALRQHGPGTLLFVTPEDEGHPAGTVEQSFPGLLHGYLNGSAEADDEQTQNVWLEICVNALGLMRAG